MKKSREIRGLAFLNAGKLDSVRAVVSHVRQIDMRVSAFLILASFVCLLNGGCRTAPLVQPLPIESSADADATRAAILRGAAKAGWLAREVDEGMIDAELHIRSHTAIVRITYGDGPVAIVYRSSTNLRCKPAGETCSRIHKSYNAWVERLREAIAQALIDPPNSAEAIRSATEVRVGTLEPGYSFEELGPISATHGRGCGLYGYQGSYEGAYELLRQRAASMGADYVRILRMTEPHLASANCYDNRYTIAGTAYRRGDVGSPRDGAFSGFGTGFVVDEGGRILTNNHVVEGCSEVRVRCGQTDLEASIVARDTTNDLALVRPGSRCGAIATFRAGPRIRPGEAVLVVGFPLQTALASTPSVTDGVVSNVSGPGNDSRLLQFTAPVQPGNSGGPLLDSAGLVTGVVVSTLNPLKIVIEQGTLPQNVNFAIRGSLAQIFLEANGVAFQVRQPAVALSASEVAEATSSMVIPVECIQ